MSLESIITISGRISSGKSYAANLIQKRFDTPIASFGGYLKYYCEQNGLPTDRKTLQDLGERFVIENPSQFTTAVVSHFAGSSKRITIEGVRHLVIFKEIENLTKNHISVFTEADLQIRFNRYVQRNKESDQLKTFEQFIISDHHPVELEIELLKPLCSIVVDSTKDYSAELFEFLSSRSI